MGVATIEVLVRLAVRAAKNVQDTQRRFDVVLHVHGADVQPGQLVQLLQVVEESVLDQVAGNVALQQRTLELGEQMRLVVAEFRLEPVLREEEYLAVRLPHTITLHPFPLLGSDGRGMDLCFKVQQTALDEQLQRRDGQADTRGLHHRLHAGVDEKILVEFFLGVDARGFRALAHLLQHVGHESIALARSQLVEDRLGNALPGFGFEACLDRLLHFARQLETSLARSGAADDICPPQKRGWRHAKALDDLQRLQ